VAETKHVDDATFQNTVLESQLPVIVDFWAPWCGPCKMMAPVLEELSKEYDGKIQFAKLNTDENYDSATQFGIQSIPTLVIFQNGKEVHRLIGFAPQPQLKRQIDRALGIAQAS
jgi:thioredoxin 1